MTEASAKEKTVVIYFEPPTSLREYMNCSVGPTQVTITKPESSITKWCHIWSHNEMTFNQLLWLLFVLPGGTSLCILGNQSWQ